MKKTILIICVAAACILFGLVAFIGLSGRNKNEEQQYRFYYINSDETRLKEEKYTPEKETTEVMLRNFSESLNNRDPGRRNLTFSGWGKDFFLFHTGWSPERRIQ